MNTFCKTALIILNFCLLQSCCESEFIYKIDPAFKVYDKTVSIPFNRHLERTDTIMSIPTYIFVAQVKSRAKWENIDYKNTYNFQSTDCEEDSIKEELGRQYWNEKCSKYFNSIEKKDHFTNLITTINKEERQGIKSELEKINIYLNINKVDSMDIPQKLIHYINKFPANIAIITDYKLFWHAQYSRYGDISTTRLYILDKRKHKLYYYVENRNLGNYERILNYIK